MASLAETHAPATPLEVRERLVEALDLDLVGPWAGHELAHEMLPGWIRPSNWYLTGFLIPVRASDEQSGDIDAEEDLDEVPERQGLAEESAEERGAAKKGFFSSSMGVSALVAAESHSLSVVVRWGDYVREYVPPPGEGGEDGTGAEAGIAEPRAGGGEDAEADAGDAQGSSRPIPVWRRIPREQILDVPLRDASTAPVMIAIPDSGGLELHVLQRGISTADLNGRIPPGTRAMSLFLVNNRMPRKKEPDRTYVFQAELQIACEQPFVPRPDLRGAQPEDWDEQVADLHYADTPEYATGHGVSADWTIVGGECRTLCTRWIPSAEVEKTEAVPIAGVELDMDVLGVLADAPAAYAALSDGAAGSAGHADGSAVHAALYPLVERYRAWIEERRLDAQVLTGARHETAQELLRLAGIAANRIERGITVLGEDPHALDAFCVANRAVARALRQRLPNLEAARWRPFQLAFILVNLPGIADTADPHRETVDLLYFPTGGGKTEAYLGLSAFTMVLRRLRHPGQDGRAAGGVSVVMRYTLRLLTLDQLARAAGLVCALELERQAAVERYGAWPFEIGLWVGKAATPNVLGRKGESRSDSARAKVRQFKSNPRYRPSPIPLEDCPWCGTQFRPESFTLLPNDDAPRELRIVCTNFECDFSGEQPLPIVAVDEQLYRRLPAFLIATVDKFASLPWFGPSGALLGGADRHDSHGFYGAAEPRRGEPLSAPLPPPDLVIQDELHLISGPLGTMAGLYETAIDGLCLRAIDGRAVRPKIVASTATVRRAQDQIQALFARGVTQVFPPPGPDRRDSFFAQTVTAEQAPARRYVGIAAQGRNPKVLMRRVWLALMGAAERAYLDAGAERNRENPADPYMTVLGYFNSLRELGGARRILEEEVRHTVRGYGQRKRIGEAHGLFRDRKKFSEVLELTSRVPTDQVAVARRRLGVSFNDKKDRVDCALATNMISVGLDIPRLGLMGVLGQPKTAAEYIQATSRVGRIDAAPGLVVTLLNVHKPRDRSHYERFRHFHETFYRSVEVGSVTPFSARALDRGFAGAFLALARHAVPELTPPRGAEAIAHARVELERRLLEVFRARVEQQPLDTRECAERLSSVQGRIADLLDSWQKVCADYASDGVQLQYQRYELDGPKPLLRDMLEDAFDSEHHRKFRVNRSLRDVEPNVNLFINDLSGTPVKEIP